ncbi:RNase H domain-containing protein [Trichonephila clavipes]|nr:RNase H domain-containing protein [Trichonephila clavipes]
MYFPKRISERARKGPVTAHLHYGFSMTPGLEHMTRRRSALEVIKEGKMGLTQEINYLLFPIGALGKSCTLQWIPDHVDIEGNKVAGSLANEARTFVPVTSSTTVFDANAVAKQKPCSNPRKTFSLPELNYSREIMTTITRLRPKHAHPLLLPFLKYTITTAWAFYSRIVPWMLP